MNTQQWTLVIYTSEEDWERDDCKHYLNKEQYPSKSLAKDAAMDAEYQGYWVRILNPEGMQYY